MNPAWSFRLMVSRSDVRHTRKTGSSEEILVFSPVSSAAVNWGSGADASSSAKRSEERRVGKECRFRWASYLLKKKEIGKSTNVTLTPIKECEMIVYASADS